MLVYFDANCFNRPFDDQSQERVHRESEAVLGILQRIVSGEDDLAWSLAMTLELSAHPEPEIRAQLTAWADRSRVAVRTLAPVRERVNKLVAEGLKALDAAHLAVAESAACDVLLTCDDRFLLRAQNLDLSLRALNPVEYYEETIDDGPDD